MAHVGVVGEKIIKKIEDIRQMLDKIQAIEESTKKEVQRLVEDKAFIASLLDGKIVRKEDRETVERILYLMNY
jgi:hypothetical protein